MRTKDLSKYMTCLCKTCGVEFSFRSKLQRKYCSRRCANNDIDVKDKIRKNVKNAFIEKYGGYPCTVNGASIDKMKQTNLMLYGKEYYTQTDKFKDKYKKTCLEKYGVENILSDSKIIENNKEIIKERYGTDNIRNSGYYKKRYKRKYSLRYNKLDTIASDDKVEYMDFKNEIIEYIKGINSVITIRVNDDTVIRPNLVDIYLPEYKLVIECIDVQKNSELSGKHKLYLINKTKYCNICGIKLLYINNIDWYNNNAAMRGLIYNKLILHDDTIDTVRIREISETDAKSFLKLNSATPCHFGKIYIGLFNDTHLIGCLCVVSSKYKNIEYEIKQLCLKSSIKCNTGYILLLNWFIDKYMPKSIGVFCDRRFFSGDFFQQYGFSFKKYLSPTYYYLLNNYSKMEYQSLWTKGLLPKKLKKYKNNLTEWENMKRHNADRIWNCGRSLWIWTTSLN